MKFSVMLKKFEDVEESPYKPLNPYLPKKASDID